MLSLMLVLSASLAGTTPAAATRSSDPFVEEKAGVTIDWRRGAIVATGGAAPDHRMPSADVARPGAERRAQAAARARMAEVLRVLPLGGTRRLDAAAVSRAVTRARAVNVDYQSNGGALVRLEIGFGDWAAETAPAPGTAGAQAAGADSSKREPPPPIPLWLPEGRLAAAPVVVVGGRETPLGSARYAPAAGLPSGVKPLTVHADKQGRLIVDGGDGDRRDLAGAAVVIYVKKVLR